METIYIWPDMPGLSIAVLVIGSMLFLFLARTPIHLAFTSLIEGTAGGLKKIANWSANIADNMNTKNRKVLLESGIAEAEHKIIEEFKKVEAGYSKHLSDYPKLHLRLDDGITKIDADFQAASQVIPEAPGWKDVVESVARLKGSSGDRVIEKMLSEIHKSAVDSEKKALSELRNTASQRHKILSAMAPVWKKLAKIMEAVNTRIEMVIETSGRIDKYMKQYETIKKGGPDSIDMLSAKATKLFLVSLLVIVVTGFGAFVNFNLIELPMSDLLPSAKRLAGMRVSEISALVIIALEIVLGIFMMESLGVTNIFPQIAGMTRGRRRMILWFSILFLFILASIEASLAIYREMIAEQSEAAKNLLDSAAVEAIAGGGNQKLVVIGQATLGFILPWILAMVAVPLENFIESSQHVLSKLVILIVRFFGKIAHMLGYVVEMFIKVFVHLYDAYIIIPTKISDAIFKKSTT